MKVFVTPDVECCVPSDALMAIREFRAVSKILNLSEYEELDLLLMIECQLPKLYTFNEFMYVLANEALRRK